ncbi:succinate dehydrogenase iron-sulfur protein [Campylobacter jejuni subsp. doylei]|nr:succinate dehydrogenase iron-sulfur protein [Campylobacter jejuni subsp. doylei]VEJ46629.1 succinate dehydrogenase iron-sulfur protein [Campylobacter jejuni subsp. doylei]
MKIIIDRFNGKEKYEQSYDIDVRIYKGKLCSLFYFLSKKLNFYRLLSICNLWGLCSACSYLACDTKMQDLLKNMIILQVYAFLRLEILE